VKNGDRDLSKEDRDLFRDMKPGEFDRKVEAICNELHQVSLFDVLGILGFLLGCIVKGQAPAMQRAMQGTFFKVVDKAIEFDGHNPMQLTRVDLDGTPVDPKVNQSFPICQLCGDRHPPYTFDESKKDVVH
jgi:hypothetical protein